MRIAVIAVLACMSGSAMADQVRGYTRQDGTYVAPYQRSAPDSQRWNNYGSQTNGGSQRDEFSNPPAYNQPRSSYQPYAQPQFPETPSQNRGPGQSGYR